MYLQILRAEILILTICCDLNLTYTCIIFIIYLTLIEENSGKGYIQEKVEENLNSILYGTQIEGGSRDGLLKNKPVLHPSKSKVRTFCDLILWLQVEIAESVLCPNVWNFRNAFFFTGTIGTTIGYGNVYPSTQGGKEPVTLVYEPLYTLA